MLENLAKGRESCTQLHGGKKSQKELENFNVKKKNLKKEKYINIEKTNLN